MNYIQPILKSINSNEIKEWKENHGRRYDKYNRYIKNMIEKGYSKERADSLWAYNYGDFPVEQINKIYQCNIISGPIKMTLTVVQDMNEKDTSKRYKVMDIKHLYLDAIDYTKISVVDSKGEIVFNPIEGLSGMPINYEDSNWFNTLLIENLLDKLKLKLDDRQVSEKITTEPVTLIINGEEKVYQSETIDKPTLPLMFMNNLDSIETTQFDFKETEKEFKERLYQLINDEFLKVEDELN